MAELKHELLFLVGMAFLYAAIFRFVTVVMGCPELCK